MSELVLKGHIWLVASVIPLLVRLFSLKTVLALLTRTARIRPYAGTPINRITEMVRDRLRAPRNMRRRACLREGLTLFHFLRLAGAPAVLHFGVYPPQGDKRMRAHCWVTVNGAAISTPAQNSLANIAVNGTTPGTGLA